MLVSRRGCSSTANTAVRGVDRDDLVDEAAGVDGGDGLRCERSAQASISSRVTPASTAAFQPTVIDMSMFGASGRSGWVGENQSSISSPDPAGTAARWTRSARRRR